MELPGSDAETVRKICKEVFEKYSGTLGEREAEAVEYLSRSCMGAFVNHCEVEDAAYFDLLEQVIGKSAKELRSWKPALVDKHGTRRRVYVINKCLVMNQSGNEQPAALVPLSVAAPILQAHYPKRAASRVAGYRRNRPQHPKDVAEERAAVATVLPLPLPDPDAGEVRMKREMRRSRHGA